MQETQELAEMCEHKQAKQARRHARQRAQMIDQTNAYSPGGIVPGEFNRGC